MLETTQEAVRGMKDNARTGELNTVVARLEKLLAQKDAEIREKDVSRIIAHSLNTKLHTHTHTHRRIKHDGVAAREGCRDS